MFLTRVLPPRDLISLGGAELHWYLLSPELETDFTGDPDPSVWRPPAQ